MPRFAPHVTLFLLACTLTVPGHAQQSIDDWPEWIQKIMVKEAGKRTMKPKTVATPDDALTFTMPGKPDAPVEIDGGWYFASDIKAEVPFECYVFTDEMDLASLLTTVADINIESNAENNDNGKVGNKSVFFHDAGAIDDVPYLALEWSYTIGEAPNMLVGFTKVRAAIDGEIAVACSHNYLGWRDTFEKAFEMFVRSADYERRSPEPYYAEIITSALGEQNIGVTWGSYTLDADGDTEIRLYDSSLIPVDAGTLQTGDTSTLQFSTPDGYVINEYVASVENGELMTQLELGYRDESWVVSGTVQGKELDIVLDSQQPLLSSLGQQRAARDLFAGDDDETSFELWLPEADPSRILSASIARNDADVARQAMLKLGPLEMLAIIDDIGSVESATMQVGPAELSMQRVYVTGSID